MLKNYLRVAIRSLNKYKGFSIINVLGLAVGTACCILIFLYITNELSYDKFNKKADRTYRIYMQSRIHNSELITATTPAPMGAAVLKDLPGVETYTRIKDFGYPVLRYKNKEFKEEKIYWVDSTFFKVFTVKFLEGDPNTALIKPNSIVLTKTEAEKYFGKEDPLGKIINADNKKDYLVTGVIKDFPQNSHFHFDFLASMSTYKTSESTYWLSNNYYTYIVLKNGVSPGKIRNQIKDLIKKYAGPQILKAVGVSLEQFEAAGNNFGYNLQSLTSIHLHSHLDYELEPNSDISYVYIFSAIAIAMLLIASINFMNLSTARSQRRAKEVGIRKTLGSGRKQLISQFIIESILLSLLAVLIAVGIVELVIPFFNSLAGKNISLSLLTNYSSIPLLIIFAIAVGLLAGTYPAFYLASFDPAKILKANFPKNRKSLLRNGLVVFQFAVSIILIIGTFIVQDQLEYIQQKNLGFNKEQVVIINNAGDIGSRMESFKTSLAKTPGVLSVTNSTDIPGHQTSDSAYKIEGTSSNETNDLRKIDSDYNFIKTYGMKMVKGRYFSREHPSDSMAVIINQAAVKSYGVTDPVGRNLVLLGKTPEESKIYRIIGVVKDFNYESLHQKIRPLVIHLFNKDNYGKFLSLKIAGGNYQHTISSIEQNWKNFAGKESIDYNFFDQTWAHLYFAEQRTSKISVVFSIIAIFIACLGLFGLAAFITEQRTKEIGIRKVLGASVPEIFYLLSKEFTKWVLIANIIAWPAAYYIMHNWLSNFAYRISISPWVFLYSGIIALIIALITISGHTVKAANSNPVKSLKYE